MLVARERITGIFILTNLR